MTVLEFAVFLAIAGVCGAIGQALAGYSVGGCLAAVGLGLVGALLGAWIARSLHLPAVLVLRVGSADFPIVWAILGSAIFVALLGLFARRRASAPG